MLSRHLLRAPVSGLFIALAGVAESPAQELSRPPESVVAPQPAPVVTEAGASRAGVRLDSVPPGQVAAVDTPVSSTGLLLTFDSDSRSPSRAVTAEVGYGDDDIPVLSLSLRHLLLIEGGNLVMHETAPALRPTEEVTLELAVAGNRIEYRPSDDAFAGPGTNPGGFVDRRVASYRADDPTPIPGPTPGPGALDGSPTAPEYGKSSVPRPAVIDGDSDVDPAVPRAANAAMALGALGYGSSVLEAVAARISGDREPIAHSSSAALAAWSRAVNGSIRSGAVLSVHERSREERAEGERARRAPRGGGWALPSGGPVERGDWSTWARADLPGLGGRVDAFALDGSARLLHFGVERSIDPPGSLGRFDRFAKAMSLEGEWLAGVGLGSASTSVDINPAGASLDHTARLVYPYLGYRDHHKLAYALVGGGVGTSRLSHPSFRPATTAQDQDSLLVFAGLGGAVVIGGRPDRLEFLLRTSALGAVANTDASPVLPTSAVAAYRGRFGLDMRHARRMGDGILSPSVGLGILHDEGYGPSGTALEADVGTRFDWRRLSFSANARTLLTSSDDLDRTLSVSGALRYSPGGLGRGFFLTASPSYRSKSEQGSFRQHAPVSPDTEAPGFGFTTEMGYTHPTALMPGLVTVAAGVDSGSGQASRDIARIGVRYRSEGSLEAGLDRTFAIDDPERASVSLQVHLSF